MKKIDALTAEEKKMVVDILEQGSLKTATTIKDIRVIDKICKTIESSEGVIEFEDADHAFVIKRLNEFSGWVATADARRMIMPLAEKLGL